MKIRFLGTRGYIKPRSSSHKMHSCMMVSYYTTRLLVDCGEDWLGRVEELSPDAIVLTHAHPDHAWGLKRCAPCPVHATAETWEEIKDFDVAENNRRKISPGRKKTIGRLSVKAFTVEHSTRCPAVGYRIEAGDSKIFYAPDLVYIHDREKALKGIDLYIGDGATLKSPMVRKRGNRLIGHVPVRTQLTWCAKENVPRAAITHCGSGIVKADPRKLANDLRKMADERGVEAFIAKDGMELVLR
ncbi:MAG: MBL fold metallo-hydrolase [Candidatus Omnitrophica bacterium]|nr:MBL fold metallo-hydrolase [Candidatus Omnitrophota bacterium]